MADVQPDPIGAIIFDLGGVLLDWDPRYLYRSYFEKPEEMEAFLTEIDFASWNSRQDNGRPFADGVAELSARFPHRSALIQAYREHWEQSISGPIAGTVNILRALKAGGYPLYALSNWSEETFPIAYRKYDFLRLFDYVLVSGTVKLIKPDPKIFQLMLHKIGRPAGSCLLIDDSPGNIAAAKKLGFRALQFSSAAALERQLVELELLEPSWRRNLST